MVHRKEFVASAEDLRSAIEQMLALYDNDQEIMVAEEDSAVLKALHGVCERAVRHARAAMLLIEADFDREANVNVRAALEHAVTAQWAYLVPPDPARCLMDATQATAAEFLEAAEKRTALPNDLHKKKEDWKNSKKLPHFTQICDQVDGTHDPRMRRTGVLRFEYKRLSLMTHVTSGTVADHLGVDGESLVLERNVPDPYAWFTLFDLAMAVALAVWVIQDLCDGKPNIETLEAVADSVGVPCCLRADIETARSRRA
jgi:hypothetical protein